MSLLPWCVALAGGLGSMLRYVVDTGITARIARRRAASGAGGRGMRGDAPFPGGIVVVNLTGSLVVGVLAGLAARGLLEDPWRTVLSVGLLGGYTTFSTASLDTVRLLRAGRRRAGIGHGAGMIVGAVAAAALGLWTAGGL